MRGSITFGNYWKGKRPYTLEVYADAIGAALQVGWQLTTEQMGGVIGNTTLGQLTQASQLTIDGDPNTVRQLSGILQTFHQLVFLPTLQDLVEATSAPAPRQGFLGA